MKHDQLNVKWFKAAGATNLPAEDKEKLEKTIRASSTTLGLLMKILVEERKNLLKSSASDYDSASWAYKQADINGQVRQLDRLLTLIDLEGRLNNDPD